ncbi:MAG: LacI family transcriptional regulator [Firmicutes bacterium]|nr:LacI family transcriptional regulator [Bacillota bacterium]
MERTRLSDIAKALNISQSTVSRALRNKPGVNPQLREKIFKMAQDLNYPFKLPKDLEFRRVGIIIPDFSNPFFATVCYGIESILRANGYLTYLASTDEDWELERDYVRSFLQERVEGLIVAPTANTESIYNNSLKNLPLVFFDRHYPSLDVQSVLIDNKDIMFQALRYLKGAGHRKICLVSGNHLLYTGSSRTDGFLEGLNILGLDSMLCPVVAGNFREPEAYEATKKAYRKHKFTAVIATSNKTTLGVLRALKDLGLAIPRDVSVIGFDNQEWMGFNKPPITTIVQPAFTMGTLAASLLLQQIQSNSARESVILKAEIMRRESVESIPRG